MSKRDTLGRHWRVKGNTYQAFTRDQRTGKETIEVELDLSGAGDEKHHCGGRVMKVAGMPRLLDGWKVCRKCSAEVSPPGN